MSFKLTRGAIPKIYNNFDISSPILQVLDILKIPALNPGQQQVKYSLYLSDGQNYLQAILATQLNDLVVHGELKRYGVVVVRQHHTNTTSPVQNRKLVVILNLDVIGYSDSQIGDPTSIEDGSPFPAVQEAATSASPLLPRPWTPQQPSVTSRPSSSQPESYAPSTRTSSSTPPQTSTTNGRSMSHSGSYGSPTRQTSSSSPPDYAACPSSSQHATPVRPSSQPATLPSPILNGHNGLSQPQASQTPRASYASSLRTPPTPTPVSASQSGSSTPSSSQRGSSVVRTDGAIQYTPLKNLHPYNNRWSVKVRVTSKGPLKQYNTAKGSGKVFSVDLVDEQGGEIRATAFNAYAEKFFDIFETQKVYRISKGTLKVADKRFSRLNSEYDMTLDSGAEVVPIFDDSSIKRVVYDVTPIASLEPVPKDTIVDVMGVAQSIGALSEVIVRTTGAKTSKRDITICDMSGRSIVLTLWKEHAERPEWDDPNLRFHHPVIAVKGARVGDFNGKSLSTILSTQVEIDPTDADGAGQLRSWYDESQGSGVFSMGSQGGGAGSSTGGSQGMGMGMGMGTGTGTYGPTERRLIGDVEDDEVLAKEKGETFLVVASITQIKQEGATYQSCPQDSCKKKVLYEPLTSKYRCDKCNAEYDSCENRYILQCQITDHSGSHMVTCFGDEAKTILGVSANDLVQMRESDYPGYEAAFSKALYSEYEYKIRAKTDTYQGESRVKWNVVQLRSLNYGVEANSKAVQLVASQ